jgi:hypothetical protein
VSTLAWVKDGPTPDGTMGGDGAYEALSVRYTRPDKPGSLITAYYYVVDERERRPEDEIEGTLYEDRPFTVEDVTMFATCTDPDDPGGTETWSEYQYGEGSTMAYGTLAEAERERDRMIAHYESPDNYMWEGGPTR